MANWFRRFDDFISQQPATNADIVKPAVYDWDAREKEVIQKCKEAAEEDFKAFQNEPPALFECLVGKESLVVKMENRAVQIFFPVQGSISLREGSGPFMSTVRVMYDEHFHLPWWSTSYSSILDGGRKNTLALAAHRGEPDVVMCADREYVFPHGKGREVYDLLLANMIERS